MSEEFCLSNHIIYGELLHKDRVKEFIKRLKDINNCVEVKNNKGKIYFAIPFEVIDKLAGKVLR